MKKFLAILMSALLCIGMATFAACAPETQDVSGDFQTGEDDTQTGGQAPDSGSEDDGEQTGSPEDAPDETPDEPSDETPAEGNVLVVYFSASGNTERVAGYIAEATGGTLFELVPADPYTSDDLRWTDDNSRVVQEYEQKQAGTLATVELTDVTVDGWENYNTVFLGFPIWWYEAAWPVYDFVESNDFTGKTIYTFCTSSSSNLGDSTQVLAEMAGGSGTWLDGRRFSSGASEATVTSWIESLTLA